jgi:hypothetical protein
MGRLLALLRMLSRERNARLLASDPWLSEATAKLEEFKRLHSHLFNDTRSN